MKSKSTKTFVITGMLAAAGLVASQFLMAEEPPPAHTQPVVYPGTPVYTVAPGSWSDLSNYR